MNSSLAAVTLALSLSGSAFVFLASKCLFLSSSRMGWWMLVANLVYDTAERRLALKRAALDAILLGVAVATAGWLAGATLAALAGLVLGLSWVAALATDLRWRSGRLARPFAPLAGRVPLPVPRLIVTVRGPILRRLRREYLLGDWPDGMRQSFELSILNPSLVRPQLPVRVRILPVRGGLEVEGGGGVERRAPEPGEIESFEFALTARRSGGGSGEVLAEVAHGDLLWRRRLRVRSILAPGLARVHGATVSRWKHGARAAFVWRGDQDLYDPATFQSAEGLRATLGLSRRFRMPSSLMLSARLSLVEEELAAFCRRFGWDRRAEEIPGFARFLRDEVDKSVEQEWPTTTDRPYSAEIGNHFYLHYGTHAAADPGNDWKSHARIGEGRYPWMRGEPGDSFAEQRDNAVKGSAVLEATLGVVPTSFTIPGDVLDADTARAVEAAGIEVGSETDASKFAKLLTFPPPHHPAGCSRLVELTRMHPRDPENAFQLAMLKYWVGAARRTGRVLVFLAHHHLARYEGTTCYQLTEELLRHLLADQDGDLYIGTLTAVGRYWRDVLSRRTRCLEVRVQDGGVVLLNSGARPLSAIPVELDLGAGRSFLRLVDVGPGERLELRPCEG